MTIRIHSNTKTHEHMIFKPLPGQFWMSSFRTEVLPVLKGRPQKHSQLTQPDQDGLLIVGSILQEPGSSGWDHGPFETFMKGRKEM